MIAWLLILLGTTLRLLPHVANFTPIAAIALFGGVYVKREQALILPLVALVFSDMVIGFDSWESRLTVYGSFLLIGVIGLLIRRRKNFATVVLGSLTGSVVFYLITNFAYFYTPHMYTHDLSGVLTSYYNALPFFRNTLLGDLFYTGLLFGSYEFMRLVMQRNTRASRSISTI